jgi:hypothetical protein
MSIATAASPAVRRSFLMMGVVHRVIVFVVMLSSLHECMSMPLMLDARINASKGVEGCRWWPLTLGIFPGRDRALLGGTREILAGSIFCVKTIYYDDGPFF